MHNPLIIIKTVFIAVILICSFQVNASVKIEKMVSNTDLSSFTVTNKDNELFFKVYFDSGLEEVALQAIPILEEIYSKLALNTGLELSKIVWAELAFVVDENYIPPRKNGLVRWKIVHPIEKSLSMGALEKLYSFIAHEQTHAIQGIMLCDLPRWFEEGQALWSELKVTMAWSVQSATDERVRYEMAYQNLKGNLNLPNWGGVHVKAEAFERQLTPEQKQRVKDDPSYSPSGPFSFGPDDLISDESNSLARYFVSLTIFESLENQLGLEKLKQLFRDVYQVESCNSDILQEFIKDNYKVDLAKYLVRSD